MRILNQYTTRYTFRKSGIAGACGELPIIAIWDGDPIPPLECAERIEMQAQNAVAPARSSLVVYWKVDGSQARFQLWTRADDPRLKSEYERLPLIKEHVVAFLATEQRGKSPMIAIDKMLPRDKVPEQLLPPVYQVETWAAFLTRPGIPHPISFEDVHVSSEEYLMLCVSRKNLFVYGKQLLDQEVGSRIVTKDRVYWEVAGAKILLMLMHKHADAVIAERLGYKEVFETFQAEEREFRERIEKAQIANEEEDAARVTSARAQLASLL